jgi:Raf kinase inhibitor-like YbhB/YbcL family protein
MQLLRLMRSITLSSLLVLVASSSAFAGGGNRTNHHVRAKAAKTSLVVTSSAFRNTEAIPREYTCEGVNKTPPIAWSKVPSGTQSFAILVEDPDAPKKTFTHWLVTGLPPSTTEVQPGAPLPKEAAVSSNDKGTEGYTGPCPPSGRHRYIFHVYALDIPFAKQLTRSELLTQIRGHVIAEGKVTGTYQKGK